jgi:deoxyribose-phosphate aldolase
MDNSRLSTLSPADLERLIDRVVDLVADRLGVAPRLGGGSAAGTTMGPASPLAPAASCGCPATTAPSVAAPTATPVAPGKPHDRLSVPEGATAAQCKNVAAMIDHTLLKPNAREEEVLKLCDEAKKYGFASVCVNGAYVDLVAGSLRGSAVKTCAVVGFPLGAMTAESKAFEAADLIRRGADEIDMVINIGALKSGHLADVARDIQAVRDATRGKVLKVIIETSLLNEAEKRAACVLAKAAEADYVKTSTGFSGGGATPEDVALMREVVGPKMGVKASGGVRDCNDAINMIESGATRLGASAGVAIIGATKPASGGGY